MEKTRDRLERERGGRKDRQREGMRGECLLSFGQGLHRAAVFCQTERHELQGLGFPGNHQILGTKAENTIEAAKTQFEI